MWLTDEELAAGAAGQEGFGVGSWLGNTVQPGRVNDRAADHLRCDRKGPLPMMLPRSYEERTTPRRGGV
jgi:hypothetical protein